MNFRKTILSCLIALTALVNCTRAAERPNILFFFADDWGRYASIYADADKPSLNDVISTPNFDRVAREGVVFENAFVPVASCGPCRASLATGRYFWNCGSGAFLNGKASNWKGHDNPMQSLPKFGDLIRESGYYAQKSVKTFAFDPSPRPQKVRAKGKVGYERYGLYVGAAEDRDERKIRHDEIVENCRQEIQQVLAGRSEEQPFFFVFGSTNVHRPYTPDSGKNLWGIEPDALKGLLPKFLPDAHDVRRDFSDYLGEVLALDLMLGAMLEELEASGELDNTVVILSGDHGIPGIPRGKTNCYDLATRVPLLVRWPKGIPSGRRVEDFVSVMDVGPTLLKLTDPDALYKMGLSTTPAYRDLDGSLTKAWMMSQREQPGDNELFHLTMHPRPREERYDLKKDPDQLVNLAADPEHASVLATLRARIDDLSDWVDCLVSSGE